MVNLSVIILTYNEEIHIERCIHSVLPIAKRIYVVDSYSTDRTVEIAKGLGATVVQHPFVNHAQQLQWAMDVLPIETVWIMRLDADEYLLPALVDEIRQKLPLLPQDINGVYLKLRYIFLGRRIRHGAWYPLLLLRIWRNGKGRIEQRWMDEHMVLQEGKCLIFKKDFCHHSLHDITRWIEKHNKYATREAIEVLNRKYGLFDTDDALVLKHARSQAGFKRIIKERFFYRLPMFLGPFLYFSYRYFIRLGFLDGKEGLVYHFLQGFWYRFLVEAKVMELDSELKRIDKPDLKLEKLEELTGYSLK